MDLGTSGVLSRKILEIQGFIHGAETPRHQSPGNMVRLTMTPAIAAALQAYHELQLSGMNLGENSEPCLANPVVGNPITHGQIISISRTLRNLASVNTHDPNSSLERIPSWHLDDLLRGSRVYIEPTKPKMEPVMCC